jgi:hypothetical protein
MSVMERLSGEMETEKEMETRKGWREGAGGRRGELKRERGRGFHISVKGKKGPGGCSQESHCPNRKIHSFTAVMERDERTGKGKNSLHSGVMGVLTGLTRMLSRCNCPYSSACLFYIPASLACCYTSSDVFASINIHPISMTSAESLVT